MIQCITYTFPNNTSNNQAFFQSLSDLLLELPNAQLQEDKIIEITASQPADALPVTTFTQSDVPFPQIHFDDTSELSLNLGNLRINPANSDYAVEGNGFSQIQTKQDALGDYYELHTASYTIYRLDIKEVVARLKSHIVRIDHTGLNIPSVLVSRNTWKQFIGNVAKQTNLYKYPTGEDWPFILPATPTENQTDITQFPVGREPKFELVYDTYSPVPTIQIDIETDLTRPQVERLFPEPYGISFPELADYFRTVYVHHDWLGLAIRFDIRFKNDEPDGDWETGKWLVTEGGRI
jgi:hypothetical protein